MVRGDEDGQIVDVRVTLRRLKDNDMATVRPGNQPVLLVVDVQAGVMADAWDAPRVVRNVARAVARARKGGIPVVWVQHEAPDLPHESDAWQLVPELHPAAGEARIHKRFESSFEQTGLEATLAGLGATHIVIAGASTNWCIRATSYAALERGYDLTLLSDAHSTGHLELGDGSRVDAAGIVTELNVTMTWLNYPGRRNGIATVEEVDFAVPGGKR
jgi:nicotinamidase-related amidase